MLMKYLKDNALTIGVGVVIAIIILISLKAAIIALSGLAAMLFGDGRNKRAEIEVKTEHIRKVEAEAVAVKEHLAEIDKQLAKELDTTLATAEEDIDQWLDQ